MFLSINCFSKPFTSVLYLIEAFNWKEFFFHISSIFIFHRNLDHLNSLHICNYRELIFFHRTCNNLHCVSCDFAVYTFDGFQWSPSTDYLFLRTNMPDFVRVKVNLIATDSCRAYACQCRNYSTSILQQVQSVPTSSWVCGGHTTKSAQFWCLREATC